MLTPSRSQRKGRARCPPPENTDKKKEGSFGKNLAFPREISGREANAKGDYPIP